MAEAVIFVALTGGLEFRELSKRLKSVADGKRIQRELNAAIRKAGQPAVNDVRRSVLGILVRTKSHGGGRKERAEYAAARARTARGKALARRRGAGLRRTVAGAVKVQITSTGIRIICDGRRLPPKQRSLPQALGARRGWRHPVFGNRERWVTQFGGPWFYVPILRHSDDFREAVWQAMAEVEREIMSYRRVNLPSIGTTYVPAA